MDRSRRAHAQELFVFAVASLAAAGCSRVQEETGAVAQAIDPSLFVLPPADAQSRALILSRYSHVDPKGVVRRGLLEDAIEYFDLNLALVPNQAFITVVDFTKFSGDARFFIVDMKSGAVEPHRVAHGNGSDPSDTGYATKFSNTPGSLMSSLGFYLTAEIYNGTHMHSMHIDGLSPDGSPNNMADTNVLSRAVVVHEATYVSDTNTNAQGRSDGCFALDTNVELSVVQRLANGSVMYAALSPLNPAIGAVPPADLAPSPTDAGTPHAGDDAGEGPVVWPPIVNPPHEGPAATGATTPPATGGHVAGGCSFAGAPTSSVAWMWLVACVAARALTARRRRTRAARRAW